MKIGGSAERIIQLKDIACLQEDLPKPIRILGNGSNILIDDRGLKGTVIVLRDFSNPEPKIFEEDEKEARIQASAGLYLPTLSSWALKRGLSGCEYMVGIPGTVGGALAQNAGANEQEFSSLLVQAEVFDLDSKKSFVLSKDECGLTYRHSILKKHPQWIVLSAELRLLRADRSEMQKRIELNLKYRKEKTPYTKPSLGSIFTRIPDGAGWLFPGKLIEDAGLKGERVGGAMVSPVHANYIVNGGGATFSDVMALIEIVEKRVLEKFGVKLQREILIWSDGVRSLASQPLR